MLAIESEILQLFSVLPSLQGLFPSCLSLSLCFPAPFGRLNTNLIFVTQGHLLPPEASFRECSCSSRPRSCASFYFSSVLALWAMTGYVKRLIHRLSMQHWFLSLWVGFLRSTQSWPHRELKSLRVCLRSCWIRPPERFGTFCSSCFSILRSTCIKDTDKKTTNPHKPHNQLALPLLNSRKATSKNLLAASSCFFPTFKLSPMMVSTPRLSNTARHHVTP